MTTLNLKIAEHKQYLRYAQILNGLGAIVAIAVGLWILSSPERRVDPLWVFWLIWPLATLHTIEEYIFPGGFLNYFNRVAFSSPDSYLPLSAKRAFITDAVTGIFNPLLLILLSKVYFPAVFIFVFLLWVNAYFHISETIKTGKYFPGVITALLLYVPGLSYVTYFYVSRGLVTPLELGIAFVVGLGGTAAFFSQVRGWQHAMKHDKEDAE